MATYITTANISAPEVAFHDEANQSAPKYLSSALTTPISAPPAIKPDAISVPRSRRAFFPRSLPLRLATYQLIRPPTRSGVLSSSGMNIPSANASAGTPIIVKISASAAPAR